MKKTLFVFFVGISLAGSAQISQYDSLNKRTTRLSPMVNDNRLGMVVSLVDENGKSDTFLDYIRNWDEYIEFKKNFPLFQIPTAITRKFESMHPKIPVKKN